MEPRKPSPMSWPFSYPLKTPVNPALQSLAAESADGFSLPSLPAEASFLPPRYWEPHYPAYGVNPGAFLCTAKLPLKSCPCNSCIGASSSYSACRPYFLPTEGQVNTVQAPSFSAREEEHGGTTKLQQFKDEGSLGTTEATDNYASPRRGRTVFSTQQLQVLERVFAGSQYIVGSQRKFLANQLRLSETQVRVWFQNRRIKWRKQMLTRTLNPK